MSDLNKVLSLNIGSEINVDNFTFSQLIESAKALFATHGMPGFIQVLITLIESLVIKQGCKCSHCDKEKHHLHSVSSRKVKTTIGEVTLNLNRLKCLNCHKTFFPMNKFFEFKKYSRKSGEFEKVVTETITNQSFRRSAKVINDLTGFETSHTTLHRWFMDSELVVMNQKKRMDDIVADGTGFKKDKDQNGSNRGELKILIGYNKNGEVYPYGAWTRANWKDVGNLVKRANHPSDKIKFKPIAGTLITDGEEELIRYLKKLANSHQRCLFHMTHELTYLLRYKDRVQKEESFKITDELQKLLYHEVPPQNEDPLKSLEDKLKLEVHLKKVKESIDNFILELKSMGYSKAKTYVENSKHQLFTYLENWINKGTSNPVVTSLVERTMREIKRRIKKIGFKWSEKGAEKMARLVLQQLHSTKTQWDNRWDERLGLNADIKLSFLGIEIKK